MHPVSRETVGWAERRKCKTEACGSGRFGPVECGMCTLFVERLSGGFVERLSGGFVERLSGGFVERLSGGFVERLSGGFVERLSGGQKEEV